MFPWVCLATMPLFYPFDWPKLALKIAKEQFVTCKNKLHEFYFTKIWCSRMCQCWEKQSVHTNDQNQKEGTTDEVKDETENINEELKDISNEKQDDPTDNDTEESNDDFTLAKSENEDENFRPIYNNMKSDQNNAEDKEHLRKNYFTMYFIIFYVVTQAFLPYSHFITKVLE